MLNNIFIHFGRISHSIMKGYQLVNYNDNGE
jgi:hypothetical protein